MRNTDLVEYACFSSGGVTAKGNTMGAKLRFTNDHVRRTKILRSIGVTEFHWIKLGKPMSKVDAIKYIQNSKDKVLASNNAYQNALQHAADRHIPRGPVVVS